MISVSLLAAAAAALVGCVATQSTAYAARSGATTHRIAAMPGKPGCFWLPNFQGARTVLNSSELIVYVPFSSDPYLIKLFEPIPTVTLRIAQRLGFFDADHTGRICNDGLDYFLVPDWHPHRIPIVAVRKLTRPEVRQLLAANRRTLPKS